jgi:hypothetical protein
MVCIHYEPITILDHVNVHMTGRGTWSFKITITATQQMRRHVSVTSAMYSKRVRKTLMQELLGVFCLRRTSYVICVFIRTTVNVIWFMLLCSLVGRYQISDSALKMTTEYTSENLVFVYRNTWRHRSEHNTKSSPPSEPHISKLLPKACKAVYILKKCAPKTFVLLLFLLVWPEEPSSTLTFHL